MLSDKEFEEYLRLYQKNPSSKIFAVVADALRARQKLDEALRIAKDGVEKNPDYAGGHLVLGRIYLAKNQPTPALKHFTQAVKLAPDNILAYQLLGDTYVLLKNSEEALKAYKMSLLINPQNEKSLNAIKKLETTSSLAFEDEVFQMKRLVPQQETDSKSPNPAKLPGDSPAPPSDQQSQESHFLLDRELSFLDALLARGEIEKAKERFDQVIKLFPGEPQLLKRMEWLMPQEIPTPIKPLPNREKMILEQKRKLLTNLLKAVDRARDRILHQHLTSTQE
ncbi:MAG: tetratricopeptide repeat protein [Bdellovibrionaceae bacterium]|nr:tetratricopeptide repeat protein [Pseudobdellovibrionaceae bacterium]MDW8190600.1 tetratricopeptide repeat protein [Pseudobdellovibrionaceae bacterium]